MIEKRPFDAYVLDYRLMDGTGLDVAEHLLSTGNEAPVILISGCESDDLVTMAEPLRISQIVEKPFSQQTICTAIKKSIETVPPPRNSSVTPASNPIDCPVYKDRSSLNIIVGVIMVLALLSTLALYLLIRNS
jgi:DNA-binding NtrC family response regulator